MHSFNSYKANYSSTDLHTVRHWINI